MLPLVTKDGHFLKPVGCDFRMQGCLSLGNEDDVILCHLNLLMENLIFNNWCFFFKKSTMKIYDGRSDFNFL